MVLGFGRYLVATRDIKPGEIIFTGQYILYLVATRDIRPGEIIFTGQYILCCKRLFLAYDAVK